MVQPARTHYSFAEYVELERYSNVRHEYLDGVIYAMAGGSRAHAAMAARIIAQLAPQLAGKRCEAHTSDLRVRVAPGGLATYPDVTVLCGRVESDPGDPHTITNPTVVFEVTSESTEDYDRGEKLEHYRKIASLRAIALVSHRAPQVELWQREPGSAWELTVFGAGSSLKLRSIAVELVVDALYEDPLGG